MLLCLVMMSAGAAFAADDSALVEASDEMAIDENVLPAEDIAVETDNVILAEATDDNIVTNETFHNYFDESGVLLNNVTSDELIFEGDFKELDVGYIMIVNKSITLTGSDAFLDGISFIIFSDDVTIDGFTMTQTDVAGIYAEGDNIVISNNFIDFTALEDSESYAINSFASNNLQLLNNTILYVGNTDGTNVNNAVRIAGNEENGTPATSVVVSGNTFELELPSVDVGYDPDTWASKVMSEGIVFYYCEDLKFTDNVVNLKYNNHSSAYGIYDTLYAVSVRSDAYSGGAVQSSGVLIADNTIELEGYGCAYAVYLCADDFEISGNEITAVADAYLAHGIDVDGPSANGAVIENQITALSPIASYGVYSYSYMGAVEGLSVSDNTIYADGYTSAGIELKVTDPVVAGNGIVVNGNYTYGIIASVIEDEVGAVISGNEITVSGSNVGEDGTGDSFMTQNSMGISVKGTSMIAGNTIESTNIGIKLVEDGEFTIMENNIAVEANALIDSYGIYSKGLSNITITDNEMEFIGNTDGTVVNNGLRIDGDDEDGTPATSIFVSGNTFDLELPSVDVTYDPDTWASKAMSEGIVFYYCEDLQFVDNVVGVKYNNHSSAYGIYDTLYAVSVRSDAYSGGLVQSSNILIEDNTIDLKGYGCAYAVSVCADNFEISENEITAVADGYLAHGIDVDGPSADGSVIFNEINAVSPMASYGVYGYAYMGAVEGLSVRDNTIYADGYASAGIELKVTDPVVAGNGIVVTGNYTYGIIASVIEDEVGAVISGNDISVYGSNVGEATTGDSFMTQNSMGISVKGTSMIATNTIESTNIGIKLVEDGEFTIMENTIAVEANALIDSYGIYSKCLSNITITGNEMEFIGNTDGTVVNNGLCIAGDDGEGTPATSVVVSGNTFDLELPSVDVSYDPDTWASKVMSEGIVFYYCEDLQFVDNVVGVKYNDHSSAYGIYDTLYAVSVRSDAYSGGEVQSCGVLIADNTIELEGYGCAYGIYLCADDFDINANNITAVADAYLAHGIDVDGPSAIGSVIDNQINAVSPMASYGVYSYAYMGAVEALEVNYNTISADGYASAGIELKVTDPVVTNNIVVVTGNYTYGIIASVIEDEVGGTISGNEISVFGSNVGEATTGDSFMTQNSMGISVKGTSLIEDNTIESTNIGIKLVEDGEFTIDGNDIAVEANALIDSYGIYSKGLSNITITDNEMEFIGNTDGTAVNNGICIAGDDEEGTPAASIFVSGNTFDLELPSVDVSYDPDTWASKVMSEGIVFYYCEDLQFVDNVVGVRYNNHSSAYGIYDTLYAVSVRSDAYSFGEVQSSGVLIEDNTIELEGYGCAYGISLCADDFEISENDITVTADAYLAHGIDVDGPSADGSIIYNEIKAISPMASYGVYSYAYMGAVEGLSVSDNTIYADGYASAGIELKVTDTVVAGNGIVVDGNYTYGIIASVIEDEVGAVILGNGIVVSGSNVGNATTGDSFMKKNSVGIAVREAALIEDNSITSTGLGINLVEDGDFLVFDNKITVSAEGDVVNNAAIIAGEGVVAATIVNNTVMTKDTKYSVDVGDADGTVHDNYLVSEKLIGDKSVYSTGYATVYDNLPDMKVILLASDLVKAYDDGQLFVVTAVDENGDPMVNIDLWAYVDDIVWVGNTDEDGVVAFNIELPEGNYTVTTEFEGDETYAPKTIENTLTVVPKETGIIAPLFGEFTTLEVAEGEAFVELTLVDIDGNPLAGQTVVIEIDNVSAEFETDENGTVIYEIECDEGEYVLTVEFAGNEFYAESDASVDIYIFRIDSEITAPVFGEYTTVEVLAGNATIELTLTAVDGTPLADRTVVIELDNVSDEYVTDENGTIEYAIEALAGEYTIVMEFAGDEFYTESNATTEISIVPVESVIIAPVFDEFTTVEVADGDAVIVVELFDVDGNPLAEKTVVIELDNISAEFTTDENGTIEYAIGALAGNYTIVMEFAGDEIYAGSNATTEISILPVESVIIAPVFDEFTTVEVADGDAVIVVELFDVDGNPLAEKTVVIELDNVSAEFTTDENGTIEYAIEALAGNYTIVMTFAGDEIYVGSNATTEISIVPVKTKIIAPESYEYNATDVLNGSAIFYLALYSDGALLPNQTVSITFNGLTEEYETDELGIIKYLVLAPAGNYTIDMAFEGNEIYLGSNATSKIIINPIEAEIIAPEIVEYSIADVIAGNATYTLVLVDADGNPIADKEISITFNGLIEEFTTDENGTVVYVIDAAAGNYTIDMAFESDGFYESAEASGTVVINQKPTKIYLRNALYFVLENKIVNVTLWDADNNPVAGKTVHITIGNLTWSGVTDENGTAHIRVGVGFGDHNATISFDGDDEFAAANRSGVVRVIKETPSLMVRGDNTEFKVTDKAKTVKVYLWDRQSKPLPVNSKVAIKVNGKTYIGLTDSQGIASINLDINKVGTFDAEVKYAGNSAYNAVTRSVKFVIS